MPESVSGVDAIVDGLREHLWTRLDGRYVRLADAVAAVHAAADAARSETWDAAQAEIEAAKRAAADARTQEMIEWAIAESEKWNKNTASHSAYKYAAESLARRFPNGGTPDV